MPFIKSRLDQKEFRQDMVGLGWGVDDGFQESRVGQSNQKLQ